MRYVSLKDIQEYSVLSYGIYDAYDKCIAEKGALVDARVLAYLRDNEYRGIYIDDNLSADIKVNPFITPKNRAAIMRDILFCHIGECRKHAESIVREVRSVGDTHLDYIDARAEKDYIYAHSVNVAIICAVIANTMKMSAKEMEKLVLAALLHDVGRQRLPESISSNRGRLSQEEYLAMKLHPSMSVQMIKEHGGVTDDVQAAVLSHHENEDGSGYPNSLTGDNIHPFAKIIHVADVYDALTANRPYKGAYLPIEALEYLEGGSDILFSRRVVYALEANVPHFPKGTDIITDTGKRAVVMKNVADQLSRPIILTETGEIINTGKRRDISFLASMIEHAEYSIEENEISRQDMISGKKSFRIMIVDDQKTNLMLLKDILDDYYELTLLKSGDQAINYLENNVCPDLILMDINMPGMDGIQTAAMIQAKTSNMVPIVFVSSNNDVDTVMACRNLGCAGYIVRPYNSVYIKSAIKEILTGENVNYADRN